MLLSASGVIGKVKGNVVSYARHAGIWGSEGMDPLILSVGTRWGKWSVSLPGCFAGGEVLLYPLNSRLSGPQKQSQCFGGEISLPMPGVEWPIA